MKMKVIIFILIIFSLSCLSGNFMLAAGEGENSNSNDSGVTLSPAYYNFGSVSKNTHTFSAEVFNNGEDKNLEAKIENKGSDHITVTPSKFFLGKNQKIKITITLTNDKDLAIGPYDLSIYFIVNSTKEKLISANSTNSLRLVFIKTGLSVASCNVHDISAVQITPFYIILGNFTNLKKSMDTEISITSKKTGAVIYNYNYTVPLSPYPQKDFYGTIKLPLPATPWDFGDYIFHMSSSDNNGTILTYNKEFNVGVMKGQLEKVETKNVYRGDNAWFNALIKNIGNQQLPITVNIVVKNKIGNIVFEQKKGENILQGGNKNIDFSWPTNYSEPGKYSIDYHILMGNDEKVGTLYYTINSRIIFIIIGVIGLVLIIVILILILIRKKRRKCN